MNIDIYKSTENDEQYLSVPAGTDISVLDFAEGEALDVSVFTVFKTSLELDLNKPRVGLNQEDIHQQIADKGYAIHGVNMEVSINLTGTLSGE